MVFVICRRYDHFRNWMNEQKLTPRHVQPITTSHDLEKIRGYRASGYVKLTPMYDPRDEERLMVELKSREFYELPHNCNDWPLTEFPVQGQR